MVEIFLYDKDYKIVCDIDNLDINNLTKVRILYDEGDYGDGILIDLENKLLRIKEDLRVYTIEYNKILIDELDIKDFIKEKCSDKNCVNYLNNIYGFWFKNILVKLDNNDLRVS